MARGDMKLGGQFLTHNAFSPAPPNLSHFVSRQNSPVALGVFGENSTSSTSLFHHVVNILRGCAEKEMIGSHAYPVVARVANPQTRMDRTEVQFPRVAMGQDSTSVSSPNTKLSVAASKGCCLNPARPQFRPVARNRSIPINLLPESMRRRVVTVVSVHPVIPARNSFSTAAGALIFMLTASNAGSGRLRGHFDSPIQNRSVTPPDFDESRGFDLSSIIAHGQAA